MPFTPFHLGPALLFGLLFFSLFDLFSLLVSSVIVDIEPFYNLYMYRPGARLHGFLHTYLGATLLSIPLSLILYLIRDYTEKLLEVFKLKQRSSFRKILFTNIFGTYFHIFLDSFLYTDIRPFFPLQTNPLLYVVSSSTVYMFCTVCFPLALIVYLYRIWKT